MLIYFFFFHNKTACQRRFFCFECFTQSLLYSQLVLWKAVIQIKSLDTFLLLLSDSFTQAKVWNKSLVLHSYRVISVERVNVFFDYLLSLFLSSTCVTSCFFLFVLTDGKLQWEEEAHVDRSNSNEVISQHRVIIVAPLCVYFSISLHLSVFAVREGSRLQRPLHLSARLRQPVRLQREEETQQHSLLQVPARWESGHGLLVYFILLIIGKMLLKPVCIYTLMTLECIVMHLVLIIYSVGCRVIWSTTGVLCSAYLFIYWIIYFCQTI